jgi:hypothetical protein
MKLTCLGRWEITNLANTSWFCVLRLTKVEAKRHSNSLEHVDHGMLRHKDKGVRTTRMEVKGRLPLPAHSHDVPKYRINKSRVVLTYPLIIPLFNI